MAQIYRAWAPVTAAIAAVVLLISITVFILTFVGLYTAKKVHASNDNISSVLPSKRLNNLSFAVITCFTINCIAFLPASLNVPYFDRELGLIPVFIVYVFWGFGYILMFFVFIRRLQEISALSQGNRVGIFVLLSTFIICFILYMIGQFGEFGHLHFVKTILLIIGIAAYFIFAIFIMVLFCRQVLKQIRMQSNDDMLQQPELLQLIIKYTVLGCIGIFTSICVTMTWAVYYSYMVHWISFWDIWTMWIMPMDAVVNMICIALYFPFAANAYNNICCVAHSLVEKQFGRTLVIKSTDNVNTADQMQTI